MYLKTKLSQKKIDHVLTKFGAQLVYNVYLDYLLETSMAKILKNPKQLNILKEYVH